MVVLPRINGHLEEARRARGVEFQAAVVEAMSVDRTIVAAARKAMFPKKRWHGSVAPFNLAARGRRFVLLHPCETLDTDDRWTSISRGVV